MNASRKQRAQWWEDQPRAGRSPEALAKVFEMARCIPGSQDAEDRRDWEEWLNEMERIWLGAGQPSCDDGPLPAPCEPYPGEQQMRPVRFFSPQRCCSLCGVAGHRKTTCPLNPKNIEVDPTEGHK
jgi:hypothetical protein